MKQWAVTALLCLGILPGCAHTYELTKSRQTAEPIMKATDSVYVAIPKDGVYGSTIYQGSGTTAAQELVGALAKRLRRVEPGREYQPFDEALKTARDKGYTHLVYPIILHWEDRATEWSGISDRVEIKVELINAGTGETLDSAIIKGKSKWATFGGDHPQDLLPKPIEDFIASLFGAT